MVLNYIVAVAIGMPDLPMPSIGWPSPAPGRSGDGFGLPYMFKKIGECTQHLGVVAIATKMSMVLPMSIFILLDPADPFTAAVLLAFPAVWLASSPGRNADPVIDADDDRPDPSDVFRLRPD